MATKKVSDNNSVVLGQSFGTTGVSFFQILRLIFVIFYLYVVGDVFYRLDGFTYYYASFSNFLPTFALATIFWSSVAVAVSLLLWLSGSAFEWFSMRIGWKARLEHYLMFIAAFIFLGAASWIVRLQVVSRGTTFIEKLIVFLCVCFIAILLPWLWRNKVERWFKIIQKLITPLVRLFGILIILSMIEVAYYVW